MGSAARGREWGWGSLEETRVRWGQNRDRRKQWRYVRPPATCMWLRCVGMFELKVEDNATTTSANVLLSHYEGLRVSDLNRVVSHYMGLDYEVCLDKHDLTQSLHTVIRTRYI